MNVNGFSNPARRSRGITLVEVLLVISLLVIVLSFALPTAGNASARAELRTAQENVQYFISTARNVARLTESPVSLQFDAPDGASGVAEPGQTIRFLPPESRQASNQVSLQLQEYRLPPNVRLESDHEQLVFDERGLLSEPGRILLAAHSDDSLTAVIEVN